MPQVALAQQRILYSKAIPSSRYRRSAAARLAPVRPFALAFGAFARALPAAADFGLAAVFGRALVFTFVRDLAGALPAESRLGDTPPRLAAACLPPAL